MAESVVLQLTGVPQLRVGTRVCVLDRLSAVVAARLALEGPQPRSLLAALLWPDVEAVRARANLRQRLLRLKQQAGVDWIGGQATLVLAHGVTVEPIDDAHAADLLQGLTLDAQEELSQWLDAARESQRRQRLQALAALAQSAEADRRWADAIACVRRQLALEPLDESHHHALVRLHYLSGDVAQARIALARCVDLLRHELGLQPGPALLDLADLIQRAAPAVAVRGPLPALLRPPQLQGRGSELRLLSRVVAEGAAALVVAEAGQGKTRLLAEWTQGHCGPGEALELGARPGDQRVPYALASRWLQALLAGSNPEPDAERRLALAPLNAEWRCATGAAQADPEALRVAALATLADAVRQGLRVIVIDDLHFADAASLELIGDLITRSRAEPCCAWLLSMRPHEGEAALPALVQQIESLSSTQRLELASLDVAAVQALVDAMALPGLGGPVHAEQLHRLTGGNPLFLLETLKALPDGPPPPGAALEWPRARGVLRLIQQRLMRLSPQALRVMRCAAVAGAELQAQRVARMLGLRPIDLADAWSELEAAQVLRGDAFTHDLVAEAAAATVPAAVAAPLHAELAQVLEDEGSIDAARVASHWQAAGLPLRAAPHLRLAARRACGQGRLREAGQMARQAAQACDGAGLRDEAFDAWFDAAFALSEAEQVEAVIDCADALDRLAASDEQRAAAACARIYVLIEQQQLPLALQLATQALPLAQQARAADLEVELLWSRAVLHWDMRQGALSLDLIETALQRADTADLSRARLPVDRTVAKLMHAGAVVALSLGLGDKAQRLFERSLREGQQQGSLQVPAGCMAALAKLALDQGDLARSRHWKGELEQVWSRMGADEQEARFVERVDLMPVLRALGAHGEALALADAMMERVGRQIDRAQNRALIEACLSYHELGRADLALRGLRDLSGRDDLLDVDQLRLAAALAQVRGLPLPPEVLIRVAELDDVGLRARLLCLAHRACDPHQILPMLSLAAGQAQDQGNPGRWLALQACRLSVLRRSGRDARALALDLWDRLQDGLASPEAYPNVAASVCAALADCETERALTLAMQTRSWMLNAATGLPTIWRESYLTRAPLLQLLGPRERAVVLGLPGATGPTALPQ